MSKLWSSVTDSIREELMEHLRRKKNLFMGITSLCIIAIIFISSSYRGSEWLWKEYPLVGISLLFLSFLFGLLWYWYHRELTITPYR
jgi:predicted Na+-dependent transporter